MTEQSKCASCCMAIIADIAEVLSLGKEARFTSCNAAETVSLLTLTSIYKQCFIS